MSRLDDFENFSREFVACEDIDPMYPVLRRLYDNMGLGEQESQWFSALYVAYYDLPSAAIAFQAMPSPLGKIPLLLAGLPCQTERRGLRGGKVVAHLQSAVSELRFPLPNTSWLWEGLNGVWGNGPWATYKFLEILKSVHGYAIEFPGVVTISGSGPQKGLALLGATPTALRQQLGLPWEQLETCLCDFYALAQGHYYIGHDIDKMQDSINRAALPPEIEGNLWAARQALPNWYCGERSGWEGVDKERKAAYRNEAKLLARRPGCTICLS